MQQEWMFVVLLVVSLWIIWSMWLTFRDVDRRLDKMQKDLGKLAIRVHKLEWKNLEWTKELPELTGDGLELGKMAEAAEIIRRRNKQ